jgi:hypothetical protein
MGIFAITFSRLPSIKKKSLIKRETLKTNKFKFKEKEVQSSPPHTVMCPLMMFQSTRDHISNSGSIR